MGPREGNLLPAQLLAAATLLAVVVHFLSARPVEAQVDSASTATGGELRPMAVSDATVELEGRTIEIHRASQAGEKAGQGIYFHKPILAFVERDLTNPPSGTVPDASWPALVWSVTESGERAFVEFRLLATTTNLRSRARDEVLKGDAKWITNNKIDPSAVDVRPWPTTEVVIRVLDRTTGDPVAVGKRRISTRERRGEYEVRVAMARARLEAFLAQLADSEFDIRLAYRGLVVASGAAWTTANADYQGDVSQALASNQIAVGDPIFLGQYNAVHTALREKLGQTIGARNADVAKILTGMRFADVLRVPDWAGVETMPTGFAEALSGYLEPILQKESVTLVEDASTVDTTTTKIGALFGLGTKGVKFQLTPSVEEKLEKKHGVKFTKVQNKDHYAPHEAKVTFVSHDWREFSRQAASYAYLAVGEVSGVQEEDIILPTFTSASLGDLSETSAHEPGVAAVPLGGALCYFGDGSVPPAGFAWLDGGSVWPSEAWVPAHLRLEPVASMVNRFPTGTSSVDKVGTAKAGASAVLPSPRTTNEAPIIGLGYELQTDPGKTAGLYFEGGPPHMGRRDYQVKDWYLYPLARLEGHDGESPANSFSLAGLTGTPIYNNHGGQKFHAHRSSGAHLLKIGQSQGYVETFVGLPRFRRHFG